MIKSAGGQHCMSFALTSDQHVSTIEGKASELMDDKKSTTDQQSSMSPLNAQSNQVIADGNDIPGEVLQLENFAQHGSEEGVKPLSSEAVKNDLMDKPVDSDDSRVITSSAELEATKDQASEKVIVQDQNSQIGTTAFVPSTYETDNNVIGSKPSKVKSSSSLFAKAISFIKGENKKPSIVSSSIALYGAQATILAGAIIGSPLGKKAMEIGEKVAKNAAEDLKEEASHLPHTLPALLWDESASPTPLPTPTPPATPSPEPVKAPSPVVVNVDPYEKRIRKARAQLDAKKSPAFLAIQELLKVRTYVHIYVTRIAKVYEFKKQ